ncbi:MAG: hypothetical protein ACM3PP_10855 [Candidatus Saccharibacteria bacterium]
MIIIRNWREKLATAIKILLIFAAIVLGWPYIQYLLNGHESVIKGIDEPYNVGQQVRQERTQTTEFDKVLDQFVLKVQDFYYEERE